MNELKRKKAGYLLDELGEIDSRMIAEAMDIKVFKAVKSRAFVKSLAFAAAAVIVTGLSASLLLSESLKKGDEMKGGSENGLVLYQNLSDALSTAELADKAERFSDSESISLFDGDVKIVWQSADGGDYYTLSVGEEYKSALSNALSQTYSISEKADSDGVVLRRVWISYGDGRVISPYLKDSAGNVGYGELFDYSPEILPSDEFLKLVNSLTVE